ncbi:hypothetical protein FB45DRAFT_877424 [Roridomyces roridus]|uniref:Uncharacterized protein n=1 Tax=Roridomyces roridus TaxID=1738132 RepID=A0AAD7B214_9AGAR|nr:hypothetical protein FB45DRAFT_877424 [Roridomyces roridus]
MPRKPVEVSIRSSPVAYPSDSETDTQGSDYSIINEPPERKISLAAGTKDTSQPAEIRSTRRSPRAITPCRPSTRVLKMSNIPRGDMPMVSGSKWLLNAKERTEARLLIGRVCARWSLKKPTPRNLNQLSKPWPPRSVNAGAVLKFEVERPLSSHDTSMGMGITGPDPGRPDPDPDHVPDPLLVICDPWNQDGRKGLTQSAYSGSTSTPESIKFRLSVGTRYRDPPAYRLPEKRIEYLKRRVVPSSTSPASASVAWSVGDQCGAFKSA